VSDLNPLEEYPSARRWLYRANWLAVSVLGVIQVWASAGDTPAPSWLIPALAVTGYIGGLLSFTAERNVNTRPHWSGNNERGDA
jgi:hypothetical protein